MDCFTCCTCLHQGNFTIRGLSTRRQLTVAAYLRYLGKGPHKVSLMVSVSAKDWNVAANCCIYLYVCNISVSSSSTANKCMAFMPPKCTSIANTCVELTVELI